MGYPRRVTVYFFYHHKQKKNSASKPITCRCRVCVCVSAGVDTCGWRVVEGEAVLSWVEGAGGISTVLVPAMDDRVVKILYMLKNCQCRDIDNA